MTVPVRESTGAGSDGPAPQAPSPRPVTRPRAAAGARGRIRRESTRLHLALAAVSYIPLLLTRPGYVSADTKTYLFLDPGRLLGRAWSMWDPSIGAGTVTHQTIGFLWPMGPFFWLAEAVGMPDWVAQRLWWGTILFGAGSGVAYLLRKLGWTGPGVAAASFAYALSPYVLTLVARLSGLLLPFVALPWLVAFAMLTARTRGWRYPALFAVTVATLGSVNATALLLVGVAPVLWLAHAVWVAREVPLRTAVLAGVRMGALTLPLSAWWISGLVVQSTNGIDILRFTETPEVVAAVSVSHELLRGLGYWFFYGGDRLGPWIEPSVSYTQSLPLIGVSYLIPVLGLVGAVLSRWRHRAYFVLLVVVGLALSVGAYPWEGGPPWARGVREFVTSDVGLAMRSLPRAVPLVALGLAVLLGSGVASLVRRWPRVTRPATLVPVALAILALPPLWLGQFVPDNLRRDQVPDYWADAAAHLDDRGSDTRVLVVPGTDFASYRWGNTVDPVLPGLMDRPSVQRELIPNGSAASANLLNAFDLRLQERTAEPESVAPVARLLRAGDVLVQSDLQFERYNTPRPRNFWDFMLQAPNLAEPVAFGPGNPNVTIPDVQLEDELHLLTDPGLPDPPEVAAFAVEDPVDIVSVHGTNNPLVVAGDGAGLVEAAAAGLLDGSELIHYSASLEPEEISAALDNGAALLLSDSNRKRGERWSTVRHTRGFTETPDGGVLETDLADNRLVDDLFPDAGTDTMTVVAPDAEIAAAATSYGNRVTFTSEERPALAVDGDSRTAWRTAAFLDGRGERIEVTLTSPTVADRVQLLQPTRGVRNRFITEVRITFDDRDSIDVGLTAQSREEPGQVVTFPERAFEKLSIEILEDDTDNPARFAGFSSLGFSQIVIGDEMPELTEVVRLPTDLLDAAGVESRNRPLAISLTRQRQDPTDVTREDEEEALIRQFSLPTARSLTLSGDARLAGRRDAETLDELLGRAHDGSVPAARSGSELTGNVTTPAAAFDGDESTRWASARTRPGRAWIEAVLPERARVDTIPLTVVADGDHSVPTEVEVSVDGEAVTRVPLPDIPDGSQPRATATVDVALPEPVTGERFRIRVTEVRPVTTNDWVSDNEVAQPVAIADVGLPGAGPPELSETFDSGCRDDLLHIDGEPVPLRITGSMEDALARQPLSVTTCDGDPLDLPGGTHQLETAPASETAIDIDQLVLRSAAGGDASPLTAPLAVEAAVADGLSVADAGSTATVEVVDEGQDRVRVQVDGATPGEALWVALGQSHNDGWSAAIDGQDLGEPALVNGFANGWRTVAPAESFEVEMRFGPQRGVNLALVTSLAAGALALFLLWRRPRPVTHFHSAQPEPYSPVLAFRYGGALPTRTLAILVTGGLGIGAWVLAGPIVGAVVGVAAGLGARYETMRRWLLLAAPAALALAAAGVLALQFRNSTQPSFDWPIEMERFHWLGWLAVLLLLADVVVDRVWQARSDD